MFVVSITHVFSASVLAILMYVLEYLDIIHFLIHRKY